LTNLILIKKNRHHPRQNNGDNSAGKQAKGKKNIVKNMLYIKELKKRYDVIVNNRLNQLIIK